MFMIGIADAEIEHGLKGIVSLPREGWLARIRHKSGSDKPDGSHRQQRQSPAFRQPYAILNSISAMNSAATNHEAFPDNTLISMSAILKLSPCANDLGSAMAMVNIR